MVYNLYKEDGPEAKAGQKLRSAVSSRVGNAAVETAKTLTTPQRVVFDNTIKPVMNKLGNDSFNQKLALNKDNPTAQNSLIRGRLASQFPEGRVVQQSVGQRTNMSPEREKLVLQSAQAGVATPTTQVNQSLLNRAQGFKPPGINPTGPLSTNVIPFNPAGQGATMENSTAARAMKEMGPIQPTTTEYGQGPNGTFTRRQIPLPNRQLGQPAASQGNTARAGNLDVTFSPGTGSDARKAFLANPVRPTAQINRFNAMQAADDGGQGARAAQNASRVLGLDRPAKGPVIGWQERKAYNLQKMENEQRDRSAQLSANLQRETNSMTNAISQERNRIDQLRANADIETGRANTDINRMNVTGQNEERGVNIEAKRMELGNIKRIQDLQNQYATAKTPEEQTKAKRALIASGVKFPAATFEKIKQPFDTQGGGGGEDLIRVDPETGAAAKVNPGGQGGGEQYSFSDTSPENVKMFAALKKSNPKEYERLRQQFLAAKQ